MRGRGARLTRASSSWGTHGCPLHPPPPSTQYPAGVRVGAGPLLHRLPRLQPRPAEPAQVHPLQEDDRLQGLLPGR